MSFSNFKKPLMLLCLLLSIISNIACDENPSYIKVYKSESAVLKDLNKDFVNIGIENLVNNLTFSNILNYTSEEFPDVFLDLLNIDAAGNDFSINNAYVLNTNTSTIATDPTNTSFIFFSCDFNFRNNSEEKKGNFSVMVPSAEIIYIKEYQKSENAFKILGKISLMFKDGEFTFAKDTPAQALISKVFNENFNAKIKISIENELNNELAKYLAKQSFDSQLYFNVSSSLSSNPIPKTMMDLKLLNIDSLILTSKFDTLLTLHYNGYYGSFANITKPAEGQFDVKKMDLSKLYKGIFVDKFLFENILNQEAFKKFFLRTEMKSENIPQALNFDLVIRDISQIIPEVRNLYSLSQTVKVNFAIFNPKLIFEDDKIPQLLANLDFSVFIMDNEKNSKQIFTCQTDLIFELSITNNKSILLNFELELVDVKNYVMSNNFSYVNIDYLRFLIQEFINYAIEKNSVKVF